MMNEMEVNYTASTNWAEILGLIIIMFRNTSDISIIHLSIGDQG